MRTSSRTVALLLFDEVELFDVGGVMSVLTTAGRQWNWRPFKVHAVGNRRGLIDTRSQIRLESEGTLDTCETPELVVVPGGYGARRVLEDAPTIEWLRRAGGAAERCLAVGNGVLLLAKAGLCDGLEVAANREAADSLGELAPTARRNGTARFVEGGKLLTAPNSVGGIEAALHVVSQTLGKRQAQAVASALGVAWAEDEPGGVEILEPD